MESLVEIASVKDHEGIVWCVAWDYKGERLASCGQDKAIRIWSFDGHQLALTDKLCGAHSKTVRSVCFAPDGVHLAAASFDGTISVWRQSPSAGWACIASLEGHENEVKSVHWSPDGQLLASCGRDKTVWIWETGGCEDGDFECLAVLPDHDQDVKTVRWHPTDQILASASYDDSLRLWTCDPVEEDWFPTANLRGHDSTVWSLDFDVHGNHMASVGDDCCMVIWQRRFGPNRLPIKFEPVQRIWNAHRRPVYSVSWWRGEVEWDEFDESEHGWPGRMLIATTGADKAISIWTAPRTPRTADVEQRHVPYGLGEFTLLYKLEPAHTTGINCVAWHPSRPLLASCDDIGCIKLLLFE